MKSRFINMHIEGWSKKATALVVCYAVFLLGLFTCIRLFGWSATWRTLGVPSMYPFFADLRTIQGGILSSSMGLNPQVLNPGDPWSRKMNYPSLWLDLGRSLNIDQSINFLIFALVVVGAFVVVGFVLLAKFKSFFLLAALVSGSSLLALERGNNDMFVLFLVFLFAYSVNSGRLLILGLATSLKIFPVAAIIAGRFSSRLFVLLLTFQIVALSALLPQIRQISEGNTATGALSYGLLTSSEILKKLVPSDVAQGLPHPAVAIVFSGTTLLLAIFLRRRNLVPTPQELYSPENATRSLFLAGAGIYCGTFIISSSWDYRLIFLILCFPFLKDLGSNLFSRALPIAMLLAMNHIALSGILPNFIASAITQSAKMGVFILLATLLSQMFLTKKGLLLQKEKALIQMHNKKPNGNGTSFSPVP